MGRVTIRIPTPLRPFTGGAGQIEVEGATVGQALQALGRRHEGILDRLLDAEGQIRGFVNIYLGETNVRTLGGLDSPLPDAAVISIVPAVAGGAR
jgi:molybdopterin converting factor small subunit